MSAIHGTTSISSRQDRHLWQERARRPVHSSKRARCDFHQRAARRRPGSQIVRRALPLCAGALLLLSFSASDSLADDAAYDRAAQRLAERIEAIPRNRALRGAIDARLATLGPAAGAELARGFEACEIVPLRVPGLFYASHTQSGADLSAVSEWLGEPVPMIATDEVGTRDENAAAIARAVLAATPGGVRAALLSASKGSADVATALATHPEIRERIAIWIDLVGAIDGTPLLDADGPARAQSGTWLPPKTADSLAASAGAAALSPDDIRGIFVVHVAAFPRVADVTEPAQSAFQWLRSRGVNDGYLMLDDYLRRPGRTLVVRHIDHYMRSDAVPERVVAALFVALEGLDRECAADPGARPLSNSSEDAVEDPEDADRSERVGGSRPQETQQR